MKLVTQTVDIVKTKEQWPPDQPFAPALIINRKQDKTPWIVCDAPLVPGQPPRWAHSEHDEYVRVPLFPYTLNKRADLAMAFMVQAGLSCAGFLPNPVTGLLVVTGSPIELTACENGEYNGIRYWFGFAITTEAGA